MKVIPISEASVEQLRKFAQETLGIEMKESVSVEKARAQISKSWDKGIPIEDAEVESEQIGSAPTPVTDEQKDPGDEMVRINIGVTEDAGGADPIQLGVNGKIMLVPRGQDVDIPQKYFEVLQHAVQNKYESHPDGGMNPVPREVPLYPYQRVA